MALREQRKDDALSDCHWNGKDSMHLFEKTKIGSARKHAALRPNPLETPAGHKVFVKRRCNFAPARRHPVDQLDGGRQLDPEGSREKKEFKIGPGLFPPTGGQAKNEERMRIREGKIWKRKMVTEC